jgi:hypothetical protein
MLWPLDEAEIRSLEIVIGTQIVKLLGVGEPIKIEMVDIAACQFIRLYERVSGTFYRTFVSIAAQKATG